MSIMPAASLTVRGWLFSTTFSSLYTSSAARARPVIIGFPPKVWLCWKVLSRSLLRLRNEL